MGAREPRDLLCVELPCDPVAPQLARHSLRDLAAIRPIRDDVLLVVSELVTNAVTHSGCEAQETITLHASLHDNCVRIAVHDPGHTTQTPEPSLDLPLGDGGLGLRLVERIARRWGVERPHGQLVWAELTIS